MDNTVVEIRAYLDSKGIKYKKSSRKSDLLKLVK
ncbi:HeH/LEM domain-containing protein [Oenococcus oeni]